MVETVKRAIQAFFFICFAHSLAHFIAIKKWNMYLNAQDPRVVQGVAALDGILRDVNRNKTLMVLFCLFILANF